MSAHLTSFPPCTIFGAIFTKNAQPFANYA